MKLVFDNPSEGKHQIIVERVGEEGRERVLIDAGDGSFTDQVSINLGNEARQEITIESSDTLKGFALRASLVIEESVGDTKMSNIALPYPVLGRADDYLDADFQATLNVKETEIIEGQAYKIPYAFDLNDEAVLKEIVSGNAKFGFEISCSGTSIRYVEFTEETGEVSLDPKKFYRKVLFSPRVFVVNDIKGFKSPNFNPEFGDMKFDFEPETFSRQEKRTLSTSIFITCALRTL